MTASRFPRSEMLRVPFTSSGVGTITLGAAPGVGKAWRMVCGELSIVAAGVSAKWADSTPANLSGVMIVLDVHVTYAWTDAGWYEGGNNKSFQLTCGGAGVVGSVVLVKVDAE